VNVSRVPRAGIPFSVNRHRNRNRIRTEQIAMPKPQEMVNHSRDWAREWGAFPVGPGMCYYLSSLIEFNVFIFIYL